MHSIHYGEFISIKTYTKIFLYFCPLTIQVQATNTAKRVHAMTYSNNVLWYEYGMNMAMVRIWYGYVCDMDMDTVWIRNGYGIDMDMDMIWVCTWYWSGKQTLRSISQHSNTWSDATSFSLYLNCLAAGHFCLLATVSAERLALLPLFPFS